MALGMWRRRLSFDLPLLVVALGMMAASPARAEQSPPGLDFAYYRTRVEPIFLKNRAPDEGAGQRCVQCHSVLPTRLSLQPLAGGAAQWTEEQSIQNYQAVSGLVTPGDPMNSRLLLHPLAAEAGGDPTHTGGKFWQTPDNAEWQTIAAWVNGEAAEGGAPVVMAAMEPAVTLDYEFFKNMVQPVFLKKRPNVARCYSCHAAGNGEGNAGAAMRLQEIYPRETMWNEEQSQMNFDAVKEKVAPGNPEASRLLIHPLRVEAGGGWGHMGGFQFQSPADPDWQVLARWVNGETWANEEN